MKYMTIDGQRVPFEDEKNILAVVRKAGINLPTFCYHSELSTYGACRMCVVENEWGGVMAACSEVPRDGMVIYTNTPKLQKHRKMILELLLASHCRDCTTCIRNGRCILQELAVRYSIRRVRFENDHETMPIDDSSVSIVRDPNKCILCGDCVRICSEVQGMGILDFAYRGSKMQVMPAFDRKLADTECINCGQCRTVCPTGALTIQSGAQKVWNLFADKSTRVVAQIAPAVRVALGEEVGLPAGENTAGKIVAALRKLGFDEVYDTSLGADLTVMEESKELAERLKTGENLPMFTSCCPGWVKMCEQRYPEFKKNISTCCSPQQMFAAVIKEHFKSVKAVDGLDTAMVSIMPCTAKKEEAIREENYYDGKPAVDVVLTTQELIIMIKEAGIEFCELEPEATDMPFGLSSGAGVLFGVTGGVTEAVLRRLVEDRTQQSLKEISFSGVRGFEGVKQAEVPVGDRTVKIGIVNGLKHAQILLDEIKAGNIYFDFIEVMACRYGCVGGGGQPFCADSDTKGKRGQGLYHADASSQIKRSEENPMILSLYGGVLKGKVHQLLHHHQEG